MYDIDNQEFKDRDSNYVLVYRVRRGDQHFGPRLTFLPVWIADKSLKT